MALLFPAGDGFFYNIIDNIAMIILRKGKFIELRVGNVTSGRPGGSRAPQL